MNYNIFEKICTNIVTGEYMEIISFTLDTCKPAKQIEETLEAILPEINQEQKKKINLIKMDVLQQKEIADKFKVSAIPTIVVIDDSKENGRILGFYPREELKTKIKTLLVS